AILPVRQHPLGAGDHRRAEGSDPVTVERSLGHPTVPPPEIAVTGDQPAAEHPAVPLRARTPVELVDARDEDWLDQVGVAKQKRPTGTEAEWDEIAVVMRAAVQEADLLAPQRRQMAEQEMAGRAGGIVGHVPRAPTLTPTRTRTREAFEYEYE